MNAIHLAMKKEKAAGELQLHSDQGFQYTSHGYFKLTQTYGITPSMSRRGNCYDNAMAENFFSILKSKQEKRRWRGASRSKTEYSYQGLLCCLHNLGQNTVWPGVF